MIRSVVKTALLGSVLAATLSVQAEWYLTRDELNDSNPCVYGKSVAWLKDDTNDTEVFWYNGKETVQLSDDGFGDYGLAMAGKFVVWVHDTDGTGNFQEIMLWNGSTTVQISNGGGATAMSDPHTDGKWVVWAQDDGVDTEIMLWNGATITQLTNNAEDDSSPKVNKGRVVWYATDGTPADDEEIYLWDGGVVTQLTNNAVDDSKPVIEGNLIAWITFDSVGTDTDVMLFDGTTTVPLSTATDDVNGNLSLVKKCLAWSENDGSDNEIFLWEKGVVTRITDNAEDDESVANYGNKLVWLWQDPRSTQFEVMYRNSKGLITPITNNDRRDRTPCFNGKTIFWQRSVSGNGDIYYFPGKTKLP